MKISIFSRTLWAVLLLLVGSGTLWAAFPEDYDPANPPEPQVLYRITATCPTGGSASGTGNYTEGTSVSIRTSGQTGFIFLYWTKNGEQYSTSTSFNYTVEKEDADFVAVYQYDPSSPGEPLASNEHRLYLACSPADACSYNRTSGAKAEADCYVSVTAYASQGFVFQGWYADGQKVSDNIAFNYLMPYKDATLTARFVYNPVSPDEPTAGEQSDIDNGTVGDANSDGVVNISDAVLLINHYLNGTTGDLSQRIADVNGDGTVNVSDAVEIVNCYLNNQ